MVDLKKVNIAIPEVYGDALSYYELTGSIYRDLTNEINQIIDKLNEHDKNFETVNKTLDELKNLIQKNTALITKNIENINKLKEKTDLHDTEITNINNEISNINIEIQNINNKITTNITDITNLKEKTNLHDKQISDIKSDITKINESITAINANISALQTRMASAESEIEKLKNKKDGTAVTFNYVSKAFSFSDTSNIKFGE